MPVVAIDGPAGSGKSTVARAVARRLGLDYLDTGAMYRSVALAALRGGVDPVDGEGLARLAKQTEVENTARIRAPDVTTIVSTVAAHPEVRAEMVRRQREWVRGRGGGVVEGCDIGSVVFPDADVKVFLTASEEERARRRQRDEAAPDRAAVAADLARRDGLDSSRQVSPLRPADDALVIDTTGRTVDDVVEEVLGLLS